MLFVFLSDLIITYCGVCLNVAKWWAYWSHSASLSCTFSGWWGGITRDSHLHWPSPYLLTWMTPEVLHGVCSGWRFAIHIVCLQYQGSLKFAGLGLITIGSSQGSKTTKKIWPAGVAYVLVLAGPRGRHEVYFVQSKFQQIQESVLGMKRKSLPESFFMDINAIIRRHTENVRMQNKRKFTNWKLL